MLIDANDHAFIGSFGDRGPDDLHQPTALAMVDLASNAVTETAPDLHFPNGIVATPDGAQLVVAETRGARLTAFDLTEDGTLPNRRQVADLNYASSDGICLDEDGAIWVAIPSARSPNGTTHPRSECVRVDRGSRITDRVATEHRTYACILGAGNGAARSTSRPRVAPSPALAYRNRSCVESQNEQQNEPTVSDVAIQAAQDWLARFLVAWNSAEEPRVRDELHYPHLTVGPAGGQVVVAQTREDFKTDFARMAATERWSSSPFDDFTAITASETKVHFETTFKRYKADGSIYGSGRVLYIVTEQDGHWGMQLRSGIPDAALAAA